MNFTKSLKPTEASHQWFVVDATDIPLGRLATQIATRLRGKHKTNYTPHVDNGDHIIVINAEKVGLTGFKAENSKFFYHTGFIGGIKEIVMGDELKGKHPGRVIERAVKRMMPKESTLSRAQFKKLHVYAGSAHPHEAQQPKALSLKANEKKGA